MLFDANSCVVAGGVVALRAQTSLRAFRVFEMFGFALHSGMARVKVRQPTEILFFFVEFSMFSTFKFGIFVLKSKFLAS